MPFGGQLQRRRAALASWTALAVAVAGVVTYAVQADGYQAHEADLNDGGIWVSSNKDGSYGRINKPIGELDGTVFTRLDTNLDIVQDGSSVVVHAKADDHTSGPAGNAGDRIACGVIEAKK